MRKWIAGLLLGVWVVVSAGVAFSESPEWAEPLAGGSCSDGDHWTCQNFGVLDAFISGLDDSITALETASTTVQYQFGPIYSPQDSDDAILFGPLDFLVGTATVGAIHCVAVGGGTIGLRLRECTNASLASCVNTEATITCDGDGTSVTSGIDNPIWDDGDWIAFELDAPVGTVNYMTFSVRLHRLVVQ